MPRGAKAATKAVQTKRVLAPPETPRSYRRSSGGNVSARTGLKPTMSRGGVAIVAPAEANVVEAEAIRAAVEAIPCLEFGTDGTGKTVWANDPDEVLGRSNVRTRNVAGGEVQALWPGGRQLGFAEECAPLVVVMAREPGVGP